MVLNRAKRLYRLALVDPDVPPSRRAVALAEAEALARLLVEVFTEFRRPAALALLQTAVALMKEAGGLELPQSSPDPA